MSGRIQKEINLERKIQENLIGTPYYVKEWISHLNATGTQVTTRKEFLSKIKKFLFTINENIEEIKTIDFSKSIIENYLISIKTKKTTNGIEFTSYSYRQNVWTCLNNFFSYLYDNGYINENFMRKIEKTKGNDLQRINNHRLLLTMNDFNKIINTITYQRDTAILKDFLNRDLALLLILMTTGIRESALQAIDIDDIDFTYNILTINDKGDIEHKYYLNDKTINVIKEWIDNRKYFVFNEHEKALFISTAGERLHINSITKIVKKYSKEALGYSISPHKLRSGLCSILYDEWGDIEKVRRAIGHANVSTTQRYIVTSNTERMDVSNMLERRLTI